MNLLGLHMNYNPSKRDFLFLENFRNFVFYGNYRNEELVP